jgi:hypothetical protein
MLYLGRNRKLPLLDLIHILTLWRHCEEPLKLYSYVVCLYASISVCLKPLDNAPRWPKCLGHKLYPVKCFPLNTAYFYALSQKLRKVNFSFVMTVCPFILMEQLGSNWKNFYKI